MSFFYTIFVFFYAVYHCLIWCAQQSVVAMFVAWSPRSWLMNFTSSFSLMPFLYGFVGTSMRGYPTDIYCKSHLGLCANYWLRIRISELLKQLRLGCAKATELERRPTLATPSPVARHRSRATGSWPNSENFPRLSVLSIKWTTAQWPVCKWLSNTHLEKRDWLAFKVSLPVAFLTSTETAQKF